MAGIGIVLVTFNRLEKLIHALDCFDRQSQKPQYVLVVDNASTDGTDAFLSEWKQKPSPFARYVITADTNTGGSGGFYMGLEAAQKLDADWIWLSDDDAFPEEDALKQAQNFIEEKSNEADNIAAICGAVINNGKFDLEHRRRIFTKGVKVVEKFCGEEEYQKPYFLLDAISYVGIIIQKPYLKKVGLTEREFFIWYDDTEHSIRLGRAGKMYCVPAIKIHHDMAQNQAIVNWKVYYGIRNRLFSIKRHFSLWCFLYALLHDVFYALANIVLGGMRAKRGKMMLVGAKDAVFSKLGIHHKYKPGWKP